MTYYWRKVVIRNNDFSAIVGTEQLESLRKIIIICCMTFLHILLPAALSDGNSLLLPHTN